MPVFAYRAKDAKRREVAGTITGESSRDAHSELRNAGLQVFEIYGAMRFKSSD